MNTYIGIDLGTSGVKLLLVDACGTILAEERGEYPVLRPHVGWTEQDPEAWWNVTLGCLEKLLANQDRASVRGISFGGQMHGLVVLDKNDDVIRPCILWNDGRTDKETAYLNETIGKEKLSSLTGNIAFAGFTAPKILWMRENEKENFDRIEKIMLPKDYLAYKLSGEFCTDYSDASGMLLLDVEKKCWSDEMLGICGISERNLPKLYESYESVGTVKKDIASMLGISDDVKIIAGAGDNAAAAVGMGIAENGSCNISLGTSGTIFIPQDRFSVDKKNALHSFAHASGKWHLMGCILSAASCREWWLEKIIGTEEYSGDDMNAAECRNSGLYFLPYLTGERSPHNDVNARGAFIGLTAETTRAQMSRAVMEGVAFALRDCLEVAKESGISPSFAALCGGGAKSETWRQIMADVLGLTIRMPKTEQGPSYGAAILAMVGNGEFSDVEAAAKKLVRYEKEYSPNAENVEKYNSEYEKFKLLYPALKNVFSV